MYEVTLLDVSNRADWSETFSVYTDDGSPLDPTGDTFTFRIAAMREGTDSTRWIDDGAPSDWWTGAPCLTLSSDDGGIVVTQISTSEVGLTPTILKTRMGNFGCGTYRIGLSVTDGINTEQLMLGTMQIVRGL